ncbi:substrate-binding domain-containing protein [Lentzea sp. NBRC 105346]|uniref:substrate-binding domain-containing protein n=1 Tax=Lentzea sp. NBRC 105346 TaxID=3032205 RepID=UPI002555C3BF|nr:substrate-binding domain-containing protein [Lentzea sp. NBRC 105346]
MFEDEWLGMADAARKQDADLVTFIGRELSDPFDFGASANAVYELARSARLDGLVVWTTALSSHSGPAAVAELCDRLGPLPLVSIEHPLPGHLSVLFDDAGGTKAAVEHLLDVHGHRRIAFVRGPATHPGAELRYRGYLEALAARGIPFDPDLVPAAPGWWEPRAAAAMAAEVQAHGPDAIVAASDFFAQAAIAGLRRMGRRVPDDIAVVGFDDLPNSAHFALGLDNTDPAVAGRAVERSVNFGSAPPPLTTVRMPFADLGTTAVELLLARLRGEAVPETVTLPPELVVRRSCGCLSVPADDDPRPDERLLRAAQEALETGRAEGFLAAVDTLARTGGVDSAASALAELRQWARRERPLDQLPPAEDLWLRTQRLLAEIVGQQREFEHLIVEKRDEVVRTLGQRLVTAREVGDLGDVLTAELPRVGIPSCAVALYDPPTTESQVPPGAVLALACDRGRRFDAQTRFPTLELAPDEFLVRDEPVSFVALPLYFKEERLGFVLFEAGVRIGWIYEALQGQIASALAGVILVERERRALAEVEEGRRRLEERVAERTAELARVNADLREQMAVRERAERTQAQLEEQLRHSQKMEAVGRLAGGIAHDFNNLLVVINGYSELLKGWLADDEELREAAEEIQSAGARAAALTRQLLTFSRQEVLQPALVDLNDVVTGVEAMLRRLIAEDVDLVTRLAPSPGLVLADRGQLEQIVVNLAVNARDAMPGGGRLTIATAEVELDEQTAGERLGVEPGGYVVLSITDTGVGMDAETQRRIFEPFFTTKPSGQGTGLGLATVFGIVQRSGGHVTVTSAPGVGTSFEVHLPRSLAGARAPEPEQRPHVPHVASRETVLLVEDEASVRTATRLFLEHYGYRVIEAANGAEALAVAEDVDAVVTDVVMPEMGGRELAERLQELRPGIPVLYVSGYTNSAEVREHLSSPSVALLQKPFTAAVLARKVRELLAAQQD